MAIRRVSPPARSRPAAGFAFLFSLLLVALLGVSLVTTSELDSTLTRRAREAELLQVGHEFRQALARYQAAQRGLGTPGGARLDSSGAIVGSPQVGSGPAGAYPARLEDLLLDPRQPRTLRHLRRLYADPITGKAEWGLVRQGGRIVGVFSLSSAEPMKRDGFDADDAGFKGARRYRDWVFSHPPDRALLPAGAASGPQREALPLPTAAPAAPASKPQAGFGAVPPPLPGGRP